jgi:hypothetical protein
MFNFMKVNAQFMAFSHMGIPLRAAATGGGLAKQPQNSVY